MTSIKILECEGEHVRVKREIIIPPRGVDFEGARKQCAHLNLWDAHYMCGGLEAAIAELERDAPVMVKLNSMGYPMSVTKMSVIYPANLEGAEFEKFKARIQSVCGSANLVFMKSEWIHIAGKKGGWVPRP